MSTFFKQWTKNKPKTCELFKENPPTNRTRTKQKTTIKLKDST